MGHVTPSRSHREGGRIHTELFTGFHLKNYVKEKQNKFRLNYICVLKERMEFG